MIWSTLLLSCPDSWRAAPIREAPTVPQRKIYLPAKSIVTNARRFPNKLQRYAIRGAGVLARERYTLLQYLCAPGIKPGTPGPSSHF